MRVVGIDLAAEARTTAAVGISKESEGWRAYTVPGPLRDDELVSLARDFDTVALDAPLGWPDAFVAALCAHHAHQPWPAEADRRPLRYRLTDLRLQQAIGLWPLSVSTDKLGVTALRAARLQARWGKEVWLAPARRDGTDALVEVYPAAALKTWGVPYTGYKGSERAEQRQVIMEQLGAATAHWLSLESVQHACVSTDHDLDALISALVGLAASCGATTGPQGHESALGRIEGWIHLPNIPLSGLGDAVAAARRDAS